MDKLPRVSGPGASGGQVYISQRVDEVLRGAEDEAQQLKDEYVSVEHLLLALADSRTARWPRRCRAAGVTRDKLLAAPRRCAAASG